MVFSSILPTDSSPMHLQVLSKIEFENCTNMVIKKNECVITAGKEKFTFPMINVRAPSEQSRLIDYSWYCITQARERQPKTLMVQNCTGTRCVVQESITEKCSLSRSSYVPHFCYASHLYMSKVYSSYEELGSCFSAVAYADIQARPLLAGTQKPVAA